MQFVEAENVEFPPAGLLPFHQQGRHSVTTAVLQVDGRIAGKMTETGPPDAFVPAREENVVMKTGSPILSRVSR